MSILWAAMSICCLKDYLKNKKRNINLQDLTEEELRELAEFEKEMEINEMSKLNHRHELISNRKYIRYCMERIPELLLVFIFFPMCIAKKR